MTDWRFNERKKGSNEKGINTDQKLDSPLYTYVYDDQNRWCLSWLEVGECSDLTLRWCDDDDDGCE